MAWLAGGTALMGVDGWRGSWVAVLVDPSGAVTWHVGRFADVVSVLRSRDAVVAVDIPVGLPTVGYRRCDLAGRAALGAAASRLFRTPSRAALEAPDLATANRSLRARGQPGVSAQAYALRHAVLEVDAVARADDRLVESHPELGFLAAAGHVLPGKRTARGVGARVAALAPGLDVVSALADAPAPVPVDDALDALVLAWTAGRVRDGRAVRYPPDPAPGEPVIHA